MGQSVVAGKEYWICCTHYKCRYHGSRGGQTETRVWEDSWIFLLNQGSCNEATTVSISIANLERVEKVGLQQVLEEGGDILYRHRTRIFQGRSLD
jgi:hypothetical protein